MNDQRRKGIILAGGTGSRLGPLTQAISKQLLPIFDKPMIYYPLSTLMLAGIKDILIITKPEDLILFQKLFSNSPDWGINIEFSVQDRPDGIASALIIAEPFLNGSPSALILGDNIFYSSGLTRLMEQAASISNGASILAKEMAEPNQYGVIELNPSGKPISIEEKPKKAKSNLVVTGLYFYDNTASQRAKKLRPSKRGELEITDLNESYLIEQQLSVSTMHRGSVWFDAGSHENLLEASNLIASIQHRSGILISSPEEIAYRQGWISLHQLEHLVRKMGASTYKILLATLVHEENRYENRFN